MIICDWCTVGAKYEVNESKACGNHLTAAVNCQTNLPPRECKVSKIRKESDSEE